MLSVKRTHGVGIRESVMMQPANGEMLITDHADVDISPIPQYDQIDMLPAQGSSDREHELREDPFSQRTDYEEYRRRNQLVSRTIGSGGVLNMMIRDE